LKGEAESRQRTVERAFAGLQIPVRGHHQPGQITHIVHERVLLDDASIIEDEGVTEGGEVKDDGEEGAPD
jgi:hypothetical protein